MKYTAIAAKTMSLIVVSISGSHSNERAGPLRTASRSVSSSATRVAATTSALTSREKTRMRRSRWRDDDAESATWEATVTSSPPPDTAPFREPGRDPTLQTLDGRQHPRRVQALVARERNLNRHLDTLPERTGHRRLRRTVSRHRPSSLAGMPAAGRVVEVDLDRLRAGWSDSPYAMER